MLALWHLANAEEPRALTGLSDILDNLVIERLPDHQDIRFRGHGQGTERAHDRPDEPTLRTPWGYLAWRLAGDAGLDLVASRRPPARIPAQRRSWAFSPRLDPSLILLDEVVAYGRQLEGAAFEAFLSFVQSLTRP